MKVRLQLPPFGDVVIEQQGGRSVLMPVMLKNDACYDFEFEYTHQDEDGCYVARLASIRETMPPITPQASGYGDDTRMPMPWRDEEAEQRRKEWEEVGGRK